MNYLDRIKEYLGGDYTVDTPIIPKRSTDKINVTHKKCGKSFLISWKNCYDKGKCPVCFKKGRSISNFSELVEKSTNGKFEYIETEMRENRRFFKIHHKNCIVENDGFWYSEFFLKKKIPLCQFCEKGVNKDVMQIKLDTLKPGEYKLLETPTSMNSKVKIFHNKCGNIIYTRLNQILNCNQSGCKFCRVINHNNKIIPTKDEFIKKLENRFGKRYNILSDVDQIGYHTYIDVYDTVKDLNFKIKASSLLQRSPKYNKSKGESIIEKFLIENKIRYESEKIFQDLKDKTYLRFDFFIPDKNLLIEFDGEQHFIARRDDSNGEKLKITQEHDKMKNKYAKDNDIKLVRIKYTEIKNIYNILTCLMGS